MSEYKCVICNKNYKTHRSLWNHTNKYHTNNEKKINCKYCGNLFSCKQSKYIHEKKHCKKKDELNKEDNIQLEKMKLEIEKIKEEKELLELKLKIQNNKQPTLKKIKKILNNKKTINNNNCNNNITNIQNNYIVNFGNENIYNKLTMKEKKQIMESKWNCLDKLIEIAHCGPYNEFKNIVVTNLKDNEVYIYDSKIGNFVTRNKTETLNTLIDNRIGDIEAVYDELSAVNKINENTKKKIEDFLEKIKDEDTQFINQNVTYDNYKSYKMQKIKILLYDNNDNITKDLAVFLS